jgi:hypothetical protein
MEADSTPPDRLDLVTDKEEHSAAIGRQLAKCGFFAADEDPGRCYVEIFVGAAVGTTSYFVSPMRTAAMISADGPVRRVIQVEAMLHEAAPTLGPVGEVKKLDLVAVEVTPNHWRRGRVASLREDSSASVFLVDTGNVVVVEASQLRRLPEHLAQPPFLAYKLVIPGEQDVMILSNNNRSIVASRHQAPGRAGPVRRLVPLRQDHGARSPRGL